MAADTTRTRAPQNARRGRARGAALLRATARRIAAHAEPRVRRVRRHTLKTWPEFFAAVACGAKTFELRKDDRAFANHDVLDLREWDPSAQRYTGRTLEAEITYVLRDAENFGLRSGFVVLGIRKKEA